MNSNLEDQVMSIEELGSLVFRDQYSKGPVDYKVMSSLYV